MKKNLSYRDKLLELAQIYKISEIQNNSKINPINSVLIDESIQNQDENSVDTFVIDSPDFEYKKEIE